MKIIFFSKYITIYNEIYNDINISISTCQARVMLVLVAFVTANPVGVGKGANPEVNRWIIAYKPAKNIHLQIDSISEPIKKKGNRAA